MRVVSQELLRSDQAIFSPGVLAQIRLSEIDYMTYLQLITQDLARGLSPLEWGEVMAQEGKLSVARECWLAAALPQDEIGARYKRASTLWRERITLSLYPKVQAAILDAKTLLAPDQIANYDMQLQRAKRFLDKDWYDLAQQVLETLQNQLNEALEVVKKERDELRGNLESVRDEIAEQATALQPFPSGEEGREAVQRLLAGISSLLEPAKWDVKSAQKRLDLAAALRDGATYDPVQVAIVLGEKIMPSKVAPPAKSAETPPAPVDASPVTSTQPAKKDLVEEAIAWLHVQDALTSNRLEEMDNVPGNQKAQSEGLQKSAENARTVNKDFKRAEEQFQRAIQLWPGNETASKNYASMLHQIGRTVDAISVLEIGVKYTQERLPFYNLLTNLCKEANQFDKGRTYAQQAFPSPGR